MRNTTSYFALACCAVFFCASSGFAQGWPDTCAHLKVWESVSPQDAATSKLIYDTLRLYIERCAASDDQSFHAFGHLSGAVQYMSDDTSRFDSFRTWLISVLYLNTTNPEYFCACIGSIIGTYTGKYAGIATLTIDTFMCKYHSECKGYCAQYLKDSADLAVAGYNTSNLPSMDSLGLGFILRHDANAVVSSLSKFANTYLTSFTSSPNPFTTETKLHFELNRMSFVTIEVYDLLSNKVFGGTGRSYEAGSYDIGLDGSKLPHGTLYARIATAFGEVKSVKLVHEN